jgi:hypothetical protein
MFIGGRMTTSTVDARAYLDRAFAPLKAAIDRADTAEVTRIVARFRGEGRPDLADIALDMAVDALYPGGVPKS